jgi:hypothetical protein
MTRALYECLECSGCSTEETVLTLGGCHYCGGKEFENDEFETVVYKNGKIMLFD